jgi:hypothetical protein
VPETVLAVRLWVSRSSERKVAPGSISTYCWNAPSNTSS